MQHDHHHHDEHGDLTISDHFYTDEHEGSINNRILNIANQNTCNDLAMFERVFSHFFGELELSVMQSLCQLKIIILSVFCVVSDLPNKSGHK